MPSANPAGRVEGLAQRMRSVLHLVDGHSYAYRAFYGMPRLSNRKGQPTQAVYGFAMFLLKLLRERDAEYVTVAFDPRGPTFRHKAFAAYKAHRKPMPDDLVSQLPIIRELVRALGVFDIEREGYEADDVMATLTVRAVEAGQDVVIYSGDKDILQLVGPHVRVVVPRREEEAMDADAVRGKWGVSPGQIVDLLALMGDSSDNLPGAPGVGEKTAALLLSKFGSVDAIYERIAEAGSPKLQEKLVKGKAQVMETREMARLRIDVPVPAGIDATRKRPQDDEKLRAMFTELEFTRLIGSLDIGPAPAPVSEAIGRGSEPVAVGRATREIAKALGASGVISFARFVDEEAEKLVFEGGGKRWIVPWTEEAIGPLKAVLAEPEPRKIVDDSKALARLALRAGGRLNGVVMDVGLADSLVRARGGGNSLSEIAIDRLGLLIDAEEDPGRRAGMTMDALGAIARTLDITIRECELERLLREVEIPVAPVLAGMEHLGIRLDSRVLGSVKSEIEARIGELSAEIVKLAGGEFNILSPKQVGEVLFKKLGLPAKKKTKTGHSTDEGVLEDLSTMHPVPGKILDYRKLAKLLGTYIVPLPDMCDENGLLHTTFHQMGTATGRLSSSDPNMQNIPIRGDIGHRIRSAFVPRAKGLVLLSADYSQIELRILAHIAGDRVFTEAFRADEDVHAATAMEMFAVEKGKVTPDQRRAAKAVNFGIIYGMTAFGLSRELKCKSATAQEYLDRYFARHPAVKKYWESTLTFARERGYVTTLFGRRRQLPEIGSANRMRREGAEREALNHPVQGTAADLMKLAMVQVVARVPDARLLLSIHDELLFEVTPERADGLAAQVRAAMEGVYELKVPLKVDVAWGKSWAECHP